jgi:hypothetical protein
MPSRRLAKPPLPLPPLLPLRPPPLCEAPLLLPPTPPAPPAVPLLAVDVDVAVLADVVALPPRQLLQARPSRCIPV